ncbi:hypothetical protein NPIL_279751 [Nephila pilipes]|uniref:Uncharacterized protein n=1 Tax=Nephila pilipes TaxID=299642 RepID=A0A8X6PQ95_NEPPI|nr:hypothetical protein NPIL_279751 [Nephila pilipes]
MLYTTRPGRDQVSLFGDDGVVLVLRQYFFPLNGHVLKAFGKRIHDSLVQESSTVHESKVNFTISSNKSDQSGLLKKQKKFEPHNVSKTQSVCKVERVYIEGKGREAVTVREDSKDVASRLALRDPAGFIRVSTASLAHCTQGRLKTS